MTADELRAYRREHPESDYVLVDVRQPEEYAREHVPGSRLLPLLDLETRAHELLDPAHQNTIFICRSGARSMRAASFVADVLDLPNVFNLRGGILAWNGDVVPNFPELKPMQGMRAARDVLLQAMNLEKGAERVYAALLEHVGPGPLAATLQRLAQAETDHARVLYGALARLGDQQLSSFELQYERLDGNVMEGGATLESALALAKPMAARGTEALLELAAIVELRAYDAYRNLAHDAREEPVRETFLRLAEQEKQHAASLLKLLGETAAA